MTIPRKHRPALVVPASVIAVLIAFGVGRYFFPFTPDAPDTRVSDTGLTVDSLIFAWTQPQVVDVWTASGMNRVTPPIPDARIGYFPPRIRQLADSVQRLYGVPAPVTLAQFALESRFGLSDLNAHNYFGHKYAVAQKYGPQPPQKILAITREYIDGEWKEVKLPFARYRSVDECFDVHGKLLSTSKLYRKAMQQTDPLRFAEELGRYYASDPGYGLKLKFLVTRYRL